MALVTLLDTRNRQAAGARSTVTIDPVSTVLRLRARLVTDAAEWVTDPLARLTVSFGFERSFDRGVTWEHWISATTRPGFLDKNGAMPSISSRLFSTDTFTVRGFITSTVAAKVGLTGEVIDGVRPT